MAPASSNMRLSDYICDRVCAKPSSGLSRSARRSLAGGIRPRARSDARGRCRIGGDPGHGGVETSKSSPLRPPKRTMVSPWDALLVRELADVKDRIEALVNARAMRRRVSIAGKN